MYKHYIEPLFMIVKIFNVNGRLYQTFNLIFGLTMQNLALVQFWNSRAGYFR